MSDNALQSKIDALVDQHRDEIVDSLSKILQFRTVSGASDAAGEKLYRDETAKCLAWLEKKATDFGLAFRNYDNELAVAELEGGDGVVGLPLHIDVVPPGDGWTHGAFDGAVADGVVYGRGTQDDKGPVIQMLYATKILKDLGLKLKRGVKLIIGTAEECGDWSDIKRYFDLEPAPEMSIVSDAAFPVINGEKGMLNFQVSFEIGSDGEPDVGGWRLGSAKSGERANIVPPHAELVFLGDAESDPEPLRRELSRFLERNPAAKADVDASAGKVTITFHGKGAHGSTPQEGHSAALDLLRFVNGSGFVSDDEADLAEFLLETGEDFSGGRLGVAKDHPVLGPTTVNLGKLRWSDGWVEVTYNTRNTMGLSVDDAVAQATKVVSEFCDDTGFAFTAAPNGKALDAIYRSPADHPELLGALKSSYEAVTGRTFKEGAIGGTTYAKVFPNAVCFGPVDPAEEQELAHQTDERVPVDCHLRNVRIYALALAKLCAE